MILITSIILSQEIKEKILIEKTLTQKEGKQVNISVAKKGSKLKVINQAIKNAKDSLNRKLYESQNNRELFDAVASGAIDAGFSSPGAWAHKEPALQLFSSIPFGPSASEYLAWIYFGGGIDLLNDIYRPHGIESIICGEKPTTSNSGTITNYISR